MPNNLGTSRLDAQFLEACETYFSRKHTFHESYRLKETQDYGLKSSKNVSNYLTTGFTK